jgi:phosphoglycolate phosphatase-like HAD superfamily hydrolase
MAYLTRIATVVLKKYYGTNKEIAKKKYLETTGIPFEEQIEILYPKNPNNSLAVRDFEKKKFTNYMSQKTEKNIHLVIKHLRYLGYKTAISSSTPGEMIREYLIKHKLFFDIVLGISDTFQKGNSHFKFIEDKFSVNRNAICFIGDSINDYFVAKENNVEFIAKIGTFNSNDFSSIGKHIYIIKDLKELTQIF